MKMRSLVGCAVLAASAGLANAQSFSESFDDITTLPTNDWFQQNNSNPVGIYNWEQGDTTVFGPQASAGYIFCDYNNGAGLATISSWLVAPNRPLNNGDTFSFWTRTVDTPAFPDRLQVRMSTNGASTNVGAVGDAAAVGDFTTLLLDINPNYTLTDYPNTWTQYTVTLSGLPAAGVSGRLAFRYFVEDGGPSGSNSDYIGVDEVAYTASNGGPVGACCVASTLTCSIGSPASCTSLGGVYHGDNTTCASANCATPGACCLPLGLCSQSTSASCTSQGGVYRGDSTSCAAANCPGGYTITCGVQGSFTDISATGTVIAQGDDVVGPFTSSVTNALVTNTSLYACTNGFISDQAGFNAFTNSSLPSAGSGVGIGLFPNWDDLFADATSSPAGAVLHQSLSENGVPVDIIEWYNVRTYAGGTGSATGSFEVKIYGAGGPALVQYLYQGMAWDTNGSSSTVGVQWAPTAAYTKSFNVAGSIADNSVCSIVANASNACYANCDHSTQQPCLNVLDFGCFLNKFAAGDTYANCDNSTQPPILNVLDFGCFLNKFAAGCSNC
jgi:hypothetical protein